MNRMNKMDKRGLRLLGNTTIEVVVALVIISLIMFAGFKILGTVFENNKEAKAEDQLEKVEEVAKRVFQNGQKDFVGVSPPEPDWIIRTFDDYNFPFGQCRGFLGCVCMCDNVDCTDLVRCEGFDFDVEVVGDYSDRVIGPGGVYGGGDIDYDVSSAIMLEAIQKLTLIKEGDIVKISRG